MSRKWKWLTVDHFYTRNDKSYCNPFSGMRSFPPAEPEVVQVELGEAYSRNCTPVGSQPNARLVLERQREKRDLNDWKTENGTKWSY